MDWLATFIFFFAVIDPIGTIPVFIAVTMGLDKTVKKKIAFKAAFVAMGVLIFFIVAGEVILDSINVPITAFQVAGGIVLFLFALQMIFGESKPESELKLATDDGMSKAIFPLAVPSLASPGAILVSVLQTENTQHGIGEQVLTTLVMMSVMAIALLAMLAASKIHSWIGDSGASVVSRVMGLILASVAANSVLEGIANYFSLAG